MTLPQRTTHYFALWIFLENHFFFGLSIHSDPDFWVGTPSDNLPLHIKLVCISTVWVFLSYSFEKFLLILHRVDKEGWNYYVSSKVSILQAGEWFLPSRRKLNNCFSENRLLNYLCLTIFILLRWLQMLREFELKLDYRSWLQFFPNRFNSYFIHLWIHCYILKVTV